MITVELKERLRKKWDFNIHISDKSPDYLTSKEFNEIAGIVASACNQLAKIRNNPKSVSESNFETP